MIPFNIPPASGKEISFIQKAVKNHKICGDGDLQRNVPLGWKINSMHKRYF